MRPVQSRDRQGAGEDGATVRMHGAPDATRNVVSPLSAPWRTRLCARCAGESPVAASRRVAALGRAVAVVLALVALAGCLTPPRPPPPMRQGPAALPDGEFRELQSAVIGRNLTWVGELLSPELLPAAANLQVDARREMSRQIINRLEPVLREAIVIVDDPDVEFEFDRQGYLINATGSVLAQVIAAPTFDDGAALSQWYRADPDADVPPSPAPSRVLTIWRAQGERWVLTGLRLVAGNTSWDLQPWVAGDS